jgi:DNA polymerase-3 subunit delta
MHVTAYTAAPEKHEIGPVAVLAGKDAYLKHSGITAVTNAVLDGEDDAAGLARFAGKDVDFVTVADELRTVSMWGDKRLVVIDDADDFVSDNRVKLEKYLEKPAAKSVLALLVKSWPKNTRLAKAVAKIGLTLECDELKGAPLLRWLAETAKTQHQKTLQRDAAALLVELAGESTGLLTQELEKLSAFVGGRDQITTDDVRHLVGGWKAEEVWAMTGAIRDNNLPAALVCLDKLLTAGEAPLKIVGGISYVFRKLAQAVEISRRGGRLTAALSEAGVRRNEIGGWEKYLRRITRRRAELLYTWLLEIDAGLKGASRLPERLQLEHLLIRLSGRTIR